MSCYHPLDAFQTVDGQIVFVERGDIKRSLQLPCGRCVGCRLERSRMWALRCVHEASLHKANSFITLTYNDEHLPEYGSLVHSDFQSFFKRLRFRVGANKENPIRYYMCGEYGGLNGRPHFHSLIFGFSFPDKVYLRQLPSGAKIYTSRTLEDLWKFGYSSIGEVTFESAAYVARYCITDRGTEFCVDRDSGELIERKREYNRMSLRPGIGANWLEKYRDDVYKAGDGYVVIRGGHKCKVPRYYDKKFKDFDPLAFEALQFAREKVAAGFADDSSPERLVVREAVVKSRLAFQKRSLDK